MLHAQPHISHPSQEALQGELRKTLLRPVQHLACSRAVQSRHALSSPLTSSTSLGLVWSLARCHVHAQCCDAADVADRWPRGLTRPEGAECEGADAEQGKASDGAAVCGRIRSSSAQQAV